MSMTPKQTWIFNFMCLLCHRCSRKKRIFEQLQIEITEEDFDNDKDEKASVICREEA